MGKWGSPITRTKWDCEGYASQNSEFVLGVENGVVKWGYTGQRTDEATEGITAEDVRWLYHYVGRITDLQLREGLLVSGATEQEVERFTEALKARLDQLGRVAEACDANQPAAAT